MKLRLSLIRKTRPYSARAEKLLRPLSVQSLFSPKSNLPPPPTSPTITSSAVLPTDQSQRQALSPSALLPTGPRSLTPVPPVVSRPTPEERYAANLDAFDRLRPSPLQDQINREQTRLIREAVRKLFREMRIDRDTDKAVKALARDVQRLKNKEKEEKDLLRIREYKTAIYGLGITNMTEDEEKMLEKPSSEDAYIIDLSIFAHLLSYI